MERAGSVAFLLPAWFFPSSGGRAFFHRLRGAKIAKGVEMGYRVLIDNLYPELVTVEEGALTGGFGSAVLEVASDAGLDTSAIHRLGIPDRFVEHGHRDELLADLGLDADGIARVCRRVSPRRTISPRVEAQVGER